MRRVAAVAALVLACGCGGGGNADDTVGDDDTTSPDASVPDGFQTLISADWTIPQGESYWCLRQTVAEDTWIQAFDGSLPLGHHHAVLTVDESPSAPDGFAQCDGGSNAPSMIYGNAPGANPVQFPDGVGVKIPAGAQLDLNLHLFNTTTSDLSGTSAVFYKPIDAAAVVNEAEIVEMGPVAFAVPSGESMVTGGCAMSAPATLFLTSPHMHTRGAHALVIATRAAGDMTLVDDDYDFYDQKFYDTGLIDMAQGDRVDITCTYQNDGAPTSFGNSTTQEMCFASTYRYPKLGGNFGIVCSN